MISISIIVAVISIVMVFRERQKTARQYENRRISDKIAKDSYRDSTPSVEQYCEYCGAFLPPDAVFCPNCGDQKN